MPARLLGTQSGILSVANADRFEIVNPNAEGTPIGSLVDPTWNTGFAVPQQLNQFVEHHYAPPRVEDGLNGNVVFSCFMTNTTVTIEKRSIDTSGNSTLEWQRSGAIPASWPKSAQQAGPGAGRGGSILPVRDMLDQFWIGIGIPDVEDANTFELYNNCPIAFQSQPSLAGTPHDGQVGPIFYRVGFNDAISTTNLQMIEWKLFSFSSNLGRSHPLIRLQLGLFFNSPVADATLTNVILRPASGVPNSIHALFSRALLRVLGGGSSTIATIDHYVVGPGLSGTEWHLQQTTGGGQALVQAMLDFYAEYGFTVGHWESAMNQADDDRFLTEALHISTSVSPLSATLVSAEMTLYHSVGGTDFFPADGSLNPSKIEIGGSETNSKKVAMTGGAIFQGPGGIWQRAMDAGQTWLINPMIVVDTSGFGQTQRPPANPENVFDGLGLDIGPPAYPMFRNTPGRAVIGHRATLRFFDTTVGSEKVGSGFQIQEPTSIGMGSSFGYAQYLWSSVSGLFQNDNNAVQENRAWSCAWNSEKGMVDEPGPGSPFDTVAWTTQTIPLGLDLSKQNMTQALWYDDTFHQHFDLDGTALMQVFLDAPAVPQEGGIIDRAIAGLVFVNEDIITVPVASPPRIVDPVDPDPPEVASPECSAPDTIDLTPTTTADRSDTIGPNILDDIILPDVKPYMILQIDWSFQTVYYIDRDPGTFNAPFELPNDGNPVHFQILDWPQLRHKLNEGAIGAIEDISITIFDPDQALRAQLRANLESGAKVTLHFTTEKSEPNKFPWLDAHTLYVGTVQSPKFEHEPPRIELRIETYRAPVRRSIGKPARKSVFPIIPREYEDRALPICWGCAQRVEAVLVEKPWETTTLEKVFLLPGTQTGTTVQVRDHPSEIGAATGTEIDAVIGRQAIRGIFTESSDPDNVPSSFEFRELPEIVMVSGVISYMKHRAGSSQASRDLIISDLGIATFADQLFDALNDPNRLVRVRHRDATISTFAVTEWARNDPWLHHFRIRLNGDTTPFAAGDHFEVIKLAVTASGAFEPGSRLAAPSGDWIYIANMLPSKEVLNVEGFGEALTPIGGNDFERFQSLNVIDDPPDDQTEAVFRRTALPYTVNLDDSTWAASLGHNVTSITFKLSPREIRPSIDDNRIFVSLLGTVDDLGQLINNPSDVIKEIATSPHLMNLDVVFDIDGDSFTRVKNSTLDMKVGFAQTKIEDGWAYMQDLARQTHSSLQWGAQGLRLVLLENTMTVADFEINDATLLDERTIKIKETDVDDLVSAVDCNWRKYWSGIESEDFFRIASVDDTVAGIFGQNVQAFECWMYSARGYVAAEIGYWHDRWKQLYRDIEVRVARLDFLALRPGDPVLLNFTDFESNQVFNNVYGWVTETRYKYPADLRLKIRYPTVSY